jgi:hypothetical protein
MTGILDLKNIRDSLNAVIDISYENRNIKTENKLKPKNISISY